MMTVTMQAPVDLAAPEPVQPSRWVVCYGQHGEEAYFRDRAAAEQAAVRLHGVVVPMVNLRAWPAAEDR